MPRINRAFEDASRSPSKGLVGELAAELRNSHEGGQPVILEQEFPTGKLRILVIWDKWDRLPSEERTAVILRAYEEAEKGGYSDRVALASGLTFPEAHASGMLPFQVLPALRKGDPVTLEECRKAMIQEGASTLLGEDKPQLRFATEEEASATVRRLCGQLPKSDQVWVVTQDVGNVEDWAQK